jgi:hypothetical protein
MVGSKGAYRGVCPPASPAHAVARNGMGRVRGVRAGVAVRRAELLLGPWQHRGLHTVGGAIEWLGHSSFRLARCYQSRCGD